MVLFTDLYFFYNAFIKSTDFKIDTVSRRFEFADIFTKGFSQIIWIKEVVLNSKSEHRAVFKEWHNKILTTGFVKVTVAELGTCVQDEFRSKYH